MDEVKNKPDFGFIYKVKESEIFVSNRPRHLFGDSLGESNFDADAYLGVTDAWPISPKNKILVWFPWHEGRMPIPEMYYACNRSLIWWVHYQKLPKIQIYCDAGTHRSVTVFGAFLLTYFPDEAKNIVANRIGVGRSDDNSDPLEYINGYIRDIPEDRLLFQAMGHDFLGHYETFSKNIYDSINIRYGINHMKLTK